MYALQEYDKKGRRWVTRFTEAMYLTLDEASEDYAHLTKLGEEYPAIKKKLRIVKLKILFVVNV